MNPETAQPVHDHEFGVNCRPDCPRWGNPVPQPGWEPEQDWYFTFGPDHLHPISGESLGQSYVVINGTCDGTRTAMFEVFGRAWSHQYIDAERAGVYEYDLQHLPLPVESFGEQVDGHLRRLEDDRYAARPALSTPAEERTEGPDARAVIASEYREFLHQEGAKDRADDFADWIVEHLFTAGFLIHAAVDERAAQRMNMGIPVAAERAEEQSGGAAALRADVVMSDQPDALFAKFRVERVDGRDLPGGDKTNARYFVLDYVNDPFAVVALEAYIDACRGQLPGLAADLRCQLADVPVRGEQQ